MPGALSDPVVRCRFEAGSGPFGRGKVTIFAIFVFLLEYSNWMDFGEREVHRRCRFWMFVMERSAVVHGGMIDQSQTNGTLVSEHAQIARLGEMCRLFAMNPGYLCNNF